MIETPIWNAMLAEYGDPTKEPEQIEPSEHPIFDEMVTDPVSAHVDPLIQERE